MLRLFGQMVRRARIVNMVVIAMLACMALARAATLDRPVRIVAFGDSLTAGYGLTGGEAFPAQLERRLKARGLQVEIANAGVSGDTTAGGLARLDWAVPDGTDAVILELGANDALRGRSPAEARKNLDTILAKLKSRSIDVLITGMRAPRNLGNEYANSFDSMFKELADKYDALFYPFFLAGVALDPKLNLPDGLHPTAVGVGVIAERISPAVEDLIERVNVRLTKAPPPG